MMLRIDVVNIQTFHVIHLCCSYDFTTYGTVNGEGWVRETPINIKATQILLKPLSFNLRVIRQKTQVPMYLNEFRPRITEESASQSARYSVIYTGEPDD